jgi:hypothetical protein
LAWNTNRRDKDKKDKKVRQGHSAGIIRGHNIQKARNSGSSHASDTGCDISAIRDMEAVVVVL